MKDIDQIKQLSIVEVIDSVYPLKKRGKSWVACCPFHNESTPSFSVSERKGVFHCFGCGAGGSVIDFWMQYYDKDFQGAVADLCRKYGIEHGKALVGYISRDKQEQIAEDKMILIMAQNDLDAGKTLSYKDKQRIKLARVRLCNYIDKGY